MSPTEDEYLSTSSVTITVVTLGKINFGSSSEKSTTKCSVRCHTRVRQKTPVLHLRDSECLNSTVDFRTPSKDENLDGPTSPS